MEKPTTPVILSGGKGLRLWPISRPDHPKQLLPLLTGRTMLQETVLRFTGRDGFAPPMIICHEDQRFVVAEQLRQIGCEPDCIVLEPVGRNTAPPAAIAALLQSQTDPEAQILLLPADHAVGKVAAMIEAIACGRVAAGMGKLVTFGICPDKPETGYGYIKRGAPIPEGAGCFAIDRFVEKPERAVAEQMVTIGGYLWNSGMFLFRADRYLVELAKSQPDVLTACRAACAGRSGEGDFVRLQGAAMQSCPSISIDHAVMEHTADGAVVPAEIGWSDVGTWDALWQALEQDADGNVVTGTVAAKATSRCLLRSDGPELVVAGLDNCVVVATNDAVLVCSMDHAQDVKALVDQISNGS